MKKGMTLVELMVALLCMTVMMGVIYQLIVTTERIQIHTGVRAEAEYNIREAMDLMLYEIRHAGYRYYDSMGAGGVVPPVFAQTVDRVGMSSYTNNITFSADFDESGTVSDNEIISYRMNNNNLERQVQNQNWEMVANNVQNVQFRYFDEDEEEIVPPLTSEKAAKIRRIDIVVAFAYPVEKGEAKTLTTTLNTSVYFRNTYNFN